jgi:hypothetical protein
MSIEVEKEDDAQENSDAYDEGRDEIEVGAS